jgi:succinate dehydrogenase / fumarate reductase flavoprotein subunit
MGGIAVESDTQMSTVEGLFAAGECAAGINGANRLGGNSLSDLLVFGKRAGEYAAEFAKAHAARTRTFDERQIERAAERALVPFERGDGENPFKVQHDLQAMMQDLVGIVRSEGEMRRALECLRALADRAGRAAVNGHRAYNTGWHTALDLPNLLVVSEAITHSALERRESRGAHFRDDYPEKVPEFGSVNIVVRKRADGGMQVKRRPIPEMPQELKRIVEENK